MLERLSCEGFRNLAATTWRPGPGRHLVLGGNGAGKTSLLEAVYLVATTRSFRTSWIEECAAHGGDSLRIEAVFKGAARADLEVAWNRERGRRRAVNGQELPLADHLAVQPVVAWSSADVEILAGSPGARRRMIDQGIIGLKPGSVAVFSRYRRALRQKRELLATGGGGLDAWNDLVADAAAELLRLRDRYVALLAVEIEKTAAGSRVGLPPITLLYRPSPPRGLEGATAVRAALEQARSAERRRRAPLVGPHRDEVEIRLGGDEVRKIASAGERKAIGLLLLAARRSVLADAGREPLVLVDDADAELDPDRLAALWEVFDGASQLLATSSRPAVWQRLESDDRWWVAGGVLRPARDWHEARMDPL